MVMSSGGVESLLHPRDDSLMKHSLACLAPGWRHCYKRTVSPEALGPGPATLPGHLTACQEVAVNCAAGDTPEKGGWGGGTNRTETSWRELEDSRGCGRGGAQAAT